MAHITGGGLPEKLPRSLSANESIQIDPKSWPIPPIFEWLAEAGSVNLVAMFKLQDIIAYAIGKVITGSGSLVGLPH